MSKESRLRQERSTHVSAFAFPLLIGVVLAGCDSDERHEPQIDRSAQADLVESEDPVGVPQGAKSFVLNGTQLEFVVSAPPDSHFSEISGRWEASYDPETKQWSGIAEVRHHLDTLKDENGNLIEGSRRMVLLPFRNDEKQLGESDVRAWLVVSDKEIVVLSDAEYNLQQFQLAKAGPATDSELQSISLDQVLDSQAEAPKIQVASAEGVNEFETTSVTV